MHMPTYADRSKSVNNVKPTTFVDGVNMATETELREVIDDLWRCIGGEESLNLQPATIEIASSVHRSLWHSEFIDGTARLEELMRRPGFAEKVEQVRFS